MTVHRIKTLAVSAFAAFAFLTSAGQTLAQAYYEDWTEYYYNAGVDAHFYYSPRSIYRIGELRQVEWTDSKPKGAVKLVYIVHIDCTNRTIESRSVKRYDAVTSAYIDAVDLTGQAPVSPVTPGSMADRLLRAVC